MKYRFLLRFLRLLIYVKRFFWWLGGRVQAGVVGLVTLLLWRPALYIRYKAKSFFKQLGFGHIGEVITSRTVMQAGIFVLLAFIAFPETRLYHPRDLLQPGQKTLAYALSDTGEEDAELEEISADPVTDSRTTEAVPRWKEQALNAENYPAGTVVFFDQEFYGAMAGGMALSKPSMAPGATLTGAVRSRAEKYEVESGDSLSSIAYQFNVSVATILWENNLALTSYLRPGQVLVIPPTTGVRHTIKKGDSLPKIAARYEAKVEDIIAFNKLSEDGTDLIMGETIMIPNGVKPEQKAVAAIARTDQSARTVVRPPASREAPTAGGFVWPSGAHTITQYFGWTHKALDIAGPFATPTYAAKAGTVEKAQCGWNGGYGCYIIINHGNGVRTLYGHHSKLLVSAGDQVATGQTIALMGNTGNVRGHTGIHLHFELIVNGARVNPLGYVR